MKNLLRISIYNNHGLRRNLINKKTSCASCEKDYKYNWSGTKQWCPHCEAYICRKCTPDKKCPRCENPVKEKLTNTFGALLIILFILILILGGTLLVYTSNLDYSALDVEDISNAEAGERIKIYGVINSTEQIAIKGTYEGEDDRWLWMPQSFYVEDDSGEIWVDNSHYWLARTDRISSGSHTQKQYWNGDTICVIGTVENRTSRGLTVKSEYIAINPDQFKGIDVFWVYLIGLVSVFFLLLTLYVWADLLSRKHQHIEHFDNFSPKKREEKKAKIASIMELSKQRIHKRTHKEKWVAFDYNSYFKAAVIGIGILTFMMVFLGIMVITASGNPVTEIDWGEVCIRSCTITVIITMILLTIATHGFKKRIGEYTLKYSGSPEEISYDEIEEKFQKIIDESGMPFTRNHKHPYKSTWEVTYEIPRQCGNISYTYTEIYDSFTLTIKVGRGIEGDNEYKEQVRASIEKVFDEYLNVKKPR